MILKVKELKLISIYLYICDIYDSKLRNACARFSNNNHPDFTDQEVITIYLYAMNVEHRLKIKQIHEFASDHLRSWFPLLHTYEAFNMRINRFSEASGILADVLLSGYYGLKMHALAFHRPDHLPFPESIVITPASENDLNVHKQNWCNIPSRSFYWGQDLSGY
jgi:hypothetical protein